MRKVLCLLTIILGACEPATECPLPEDDGGITMPDASTQETWRCVGVFSYEVGNQHIAFVSSEAAPVYEGEDDDVPAPAVLARVNFEGCTFTIVPGDGHGHADVSGRFDMEVPPWVADVANPACAGLTGGSARVWRQTWMADAAPFYVNDFEVARDGEVLVSTSLVCAPDLE